MSDVRGGSDDFPPASPMLGGSGPYGRLVRTGPRDRGAGRWRLLLTAAGITVSVALMLVVASFAHGATVGYTARFGALTDRLVITPLLDRVPAGEPLSDGDATALGDRRNAPDIAEVATARTARLTVSSGQVRDFTVALIGGAQNYPGMAGMRLAAGTWFTPGQATPTDEVVLGARAAATLFGAHTARDLLPAFGTQMLVLADRNFLPHALARDVLATGHLWWARVVLADPDRGAGRRHVPGLAAPAAQGRRPGFFIRDRPNRASPRVTKKTGDFPARKDHPSVVDVTRRIQLVRFSDSAMFNPC